MRRWRRFVLLAVLGLALVFVPLRDGRSHQEQLSARHLAAGVQLYRHHQNLFFYRELPKRREILDRAERQIRAALALDPNRWDAHFYLGQIYFALDRYPEAIARFERALALNRDLPETYSTLGVLYYKTGKLDLSRAYFEASLRLRPDNAQVQGLLDLVIQLQKRSEEARRAGS